jgi:hypothetical protein
MLDERDRDFIKKWWEIATTISPNRKDVKGRRIGLKMYEQHATHYLQES